MSDESRRGEPQQRAGHCLHAGLLPSNEADPCGSGEGERWLDSAVLTTDASGNADFDLVLAAVAVSGKVITASTTDPEGDTSEFSNANVLTRVPIQIDVKPGALPRWPRGIAW